VKADCAEPREDSVGEPEPRTNKDQNDTLAKPDVLPVNKPPAKGKGGYVGKTEIIPGRSSRRTVVVASGVAAVAVTIPILIGLLHNSDEKAAAATSSQLPTAPVATTTPFFGLDKQCAIVTAPSSDVFVDLGDPKPRKTKYRGNELVLYPLPQQIRGGVRFAAVRLPDRRDSPTGHGWMQADELTLATCDIPLKPLNLALPPLPDY
jgi:hypothetical protein